jgi:hypothetical protein
MRKYLDRQILRLWIWLMTVDTRRDDSPTCYLTPGDAERLLQALVRMNDVLAKLP